MGMVDDDDDNSGVPIIIGTATTACANVWITIIIYFY